MKYGRLCLTPLADADTVPSCSELWLPITECVEWDGLVSCSAMDRVRKIRLTFTVLPPVYGEFTITERDSVTARGTPVLIERPAPQQDSTYPMLQGFIAGHYVLHCRCDRVSRYRVDLMVHEWTSID